MFPAGPLRDRLFRLLRSERGMALPTALFATVAAMGLGGAAVMASVDVQRGTKRDTGSKNAIAAADAGANVAIMRLNNYGGELSAEYPCLGLSGGTLVKFAEDDPAEPGWCPAIAGEVGGNSYSYRVSAFDAGCGDHDLCLVSTGNADGVSRRIEMLLDGDGGLGPVDPDDPDDPNDPADPEPEEEEELTGPAIEGLVGQDWIDLSGNADIRVTIGTNGDLTTSGNASICADIRYGIGKKWNKSGNSKQCSGYVKVEDNKTLPPVSSFMPSDIATNNSNWRLAYCTQTTPTKVPPGCQSDSFTGTGVSWTSTTPWNSSKRTISAAGNSTLTVSGGDYWVCRISLSGNSMFIMGAGSRVRFFFDTPENCGLSSGTAQIEMSGNNKIAATGYQPSKGQYEMPGFYLLGSTSRTTRVNLSGNSATTNELIIYGPNTKIEISGNANYKGIIAGKTITMSGNGRFSQDAGFPLPPELKPPSKDDDPGDPGDPDDPGDPGGSGAPPHFEAKSYVECSGATASPPNASC